MIASSILSPPTRHRLAVNHPVKGDDGNVRCASPDIHDHVAGRLSDREPDADGGRHRFFQQIDLSCARCLGRVLDRPLLHLRDPGRHADDYPRRHKTSPVMDLLNKIFEHLAGCVEVRDDAVFHRPDGHDIGRGLAEHSFCFDADRYRLFIVLPYHDDGRLIADNAFPFHVDEGVGGAEVYCKIIRKQSEYVMEKHVTSN